MLSDKSKLQKEVKGYDGIYQTFKTFADCILFINIHVYKNVQKHAWTLNIPTSGVVNSNMKVRGKDRVFLMFTTLCFFTKILPEKLWQKVNSVKCMWCIHN